MYQSRIILLICFLLGSISTELMGQKRNIRQEDHFYRRRVVSRIDLSEKINRPLIQAQSALYQTSENANYRGFVVALMNGLKEGRYTAYNPEKLSESLTYEDVLAIIQQYEYNVEDKLIETEEIMDDFPSDEWITEDESGEDWEWDNEGIATTDIDYSPFESVVQFVEDWIFDKNRGEMVYQVDQIQIIWSDPDEVLPEKYVATFRYEDVRETLDQVQWTNRFNDAESRTVAEIFDLRLFHSYIINVSGSGVNSLAESEFRRHALVEYEHHLWHY